LSVFNGNLTHAGMDGKLPRTPNLPSYIRNNRFPNTPIKPISQASLMNMEYNIFQGRDVPQDNLMLGIPLAEQYSERFTSPTGQNPTLRSLSSISQTPTQANLPSLLQLSSYPNTMWIRRPPWANCLHGQPTVSLSYPDAFTSQEMRDRDTAGFTAYNLHVRVDQDIIDANEMIIGNFNSYNNAFVLLDPARYENHSNKFIYAYEVP
jgi:hypothetical protein